MRTNYLYNNEAVSTVAIGHFVRTHKMVDIATILMILPFVLHEPSVKRLNSISNKRSLEEFIVMYPDCLINLNNRFLDFLPLTINAITILSEGKAIQINRDKVFFTGDADFNLENSGKRIQRIIKANIALSSLFELEKASNIFLKLKIQL